MLSIDVCVVFFITCASAAVLRPRDDGFIFEDIDGKRYLGYGIAPTSLGTLVSLEFYDVIFDSNNCSDMEVKVYSDAYIRKDESLIQTICDPKELENFQSESPKGFYVEVNSSENVQNGMIKARFSSPDGLHVTHQIMHR